METRPTGYLERVDIYVKLSVIVGARSPRPLTNAGWNPQTIRVELIVGRDSYLDSIIYCAPAERNVYRIGLMHIEEILCQKPAQNC